MPRRIAAAVFLCLALPFSATPSDKNNKPLSEIKPAAPAMVLWYRQPATKWVEANPIGNGRLGGMVFGKVDTEHIQLNEDTVWAGEKRDRNNPEALKNLQEVRRLPFAGKPVEAQTLAENTLMGIPKRLPPYQPLGDLWIKFAASPGEVTDYRRELDLEEGIARLNYRIGSARCSRQVFSSAVDQLLVVHLDCDQPGQISFSATLTREQDSVTRAQAPDRVAMTGTAIAWDEERHSEERKVGVKFVALLRAIPRGGTIEVERDGLHIDNADQVTLVLSAATNLRDPDPLLVAEEYLRASEKPFSQLRSAHVADHRKFFRRVDFALESGEQPPTNLPTDERLKRVQSGESDLQLEALY